MARMNMPVSLPDVRNGAEKRTRSIMEYLARNLI